MTPEDVIAEAVEWREGAKAALTALAAAGYAVVPQADVDAAARLRDAVQHYVTLYHQTTTPQLLFESLERAYRAAAAVGSVNPEGERCKVCGGFAMFPCDSEQHHARPDRCPTCGSDDPRPNAKWCPYCDGPEQDYHTACMEIVCPDPWHYPDPDREQ